MKLIKEIFEVPADKPNERDGFGAHVGYCLFAFGWYLLTGGIALFVIVVFFGWVIAMITSPAVLIASLTVALLFVLCGWRSWHRMHGKKNAANRGDD